MGYLQPDQQKSGTITWSTNEVKKASISIRSNTYHVQPYVELDYKCEGEPVKYQVKMVCIPSNLGVGVVWYFLCPETNKRCRKLYSISGYFLHREAFKDCMYECQTKSKSHRKMDKRFAAYFKSDELHEELYSKHFKKTYAGKPTKRYLRIMEQIQKAEIPN